MSLRPLIEELADAEHQRWAHWQKHVHEQCRSLPDGSLVIPAELAERWARQIETSYAQLSETEKASDRDQVQKILPILAKYFPVQNEGFIEGDHAVKSRPE